MVLGYSRLEGRGTHDRATCVISGPTQFDNFRKCSLTGSYLISLLITAACSNLNEESRVPREPTLASRGVT